MIPLAFAEARDRAVSCSNNRQSQQNLVLWAPHILPSVPRDPEGTVGSMAGVSLSSGAESSHSQELHARVICAWTQEAQVCGSTEQDDATLRGLGVGSRRGVGQAGQEGVRGSMAGVQAGVSYQS